MLKSFLLSLLFLLCATVALAAVNINTADKGQLQSLSGVGPAKADDIIKYRTDKGPFKTVDELAKVKGIGAKTVEKLRKDISVSDK